MPALLCLGSHSVAPLVAATATPNAPASPAAAAKFARVEEDAWTWKARAPAVRRRTKGRINRARENMALLNVYGWYRMDGVCVTSSQQESRGATPFSNSSVMLPNCSLMRFKSFSGKVSADGRKKNEKQRTIGLHRELELEAVCRVAA